MPTPMTVSLCARLHRLCFSSRPALCVASGVLFTLAAASAGAAEPSHPVAAAAQKAPAASTLTLAPATTTVSAKTSAAPVLSIGSITIAPGPPAPSKKAQMKAAPAPARHRSSPHKLGPRDFATPAYLLNRA